MDIPQSLRGLVVAIPLATLVTPNVVPQFRILWLLRTNNVRVVTHASGHFLRREGKSPWEHKLKITPQGDVILRWNIPCAHKNFCLGEYTHHSEGNGQNCCYGCFIRRMILTSEPILLNLHPEWLDSIARKWLTHDQQVHWYPRS